MLKYDLLKASVFVPRNNKQILIFFCDIDVRLVVKLYLGDNIKCYIQSLQLEAAYTSIEFQFVSSPCLIL